ncbi:unnamed protein product [Candida verbasci]|uniref:Uncharacterized protein n=1 Tax=Candida verbasci TaxID=1227364 RepID=A0A9W4TZS3_9ASCO|nr:unnamed protein product [Candida verbasci]
MSLPFLTTKEEIEHDLEKSSTTTTHLHPSSKPILKRLLFALFIELVISSTIYYNYDKINVINPMLGPTLLGCFSGALAQSINQYFKKKFTLNKIFKFMVWGLINGYFTAAWINILITRVENLFYRIMTDQFIGAPIFQLIFNLLNSLWDQGELFTITTKNSFFKSLKYSYCYWPFVSIFSFVFIPQSLMFPCNCLANLLWNIILSKLA